MFNFEERSLVTLTPNYQPPKCNATQFRWEMHAPLPFVIPSKDCLSASFECDGRRYSARFHNHFDRETLITDALRPVPQVRLVEKLKDGVMLPASPAGYKILREYLQSVVVIAEDKEYKSVSTAFNGAEKKIKDAFDWLGEYLGKLQRSLPYAAAWCMYPVSIFDVAVVHHKVDHFCQTTQNWVLVGGGVAVSLPRQLRAPLFLADLQNVAQMPPELDLANELLAEAQLAIFRRVPRLAVLNSFTAIETLANSIYRSQRVSQLVGWGVPSDDAEAIAENERKGHRTDEKFLFGSGMKSATGRSLVEENKKLFDDLIGLEEKIRHQVSHRGLRPTIDEARAIVVACCEGVRWLCDVGGLPKKEMVAPPHKSFSAFASAANMPPHTCSAVEMEVLRRIFGIVAVPDGRNQTIQEQTGASAPKPPIEQDIRDLAYQKWEAAGHPFGDDLHFWFAAEKELCAGEGKVAIAP
jgi:hypothetical protein